MNKQDEERVREIAREEALKCIREQNARFVPIKIQLKNTTKGDSIKA